MTAPNGPRRSVSLGRAHLLVSNFLRDARRAALTLETLVPVGDVRRFEPEVNAVVLLGTAPRGAHPAILDTLARLPFVTQFTRTSAQSLRLTLERGDIDVHMTAPEDSGAALAWHTGTAKHVEELQARALRRGLRFDDAALRTETGEPVVCPSEQDFYERLDLSFIPPELRSGDAEFLRADEHSLPRLVTAADIRGDLHTHTEWSDGTDTIERMVTAARQLGYEYVAITDHSLRSPASRTLTSDDVFRQREEIESIQNRFRSITILHGIEVDILPDGELDFDDDLLATFDIVLASLHMDGGQTADELTQRYLNAIHHPLVNVITHPANRTPGRSRGFDVDFDSLFAVAARNGTAIEVDGAPGHLDLDGALAQRAAAVGVTLTIDSDCHRADWLARQMHFGVGTARRGWVEADSVLNTHSLETVRNFISLKRSRG